MVKFHLRNQTLFYMLYGLYQRVVIGLGMIIMVGFILLGFVFVDQLKFEGVLLAFARITVGWLGLGLFFIFYAFSQLNQPDPRKIKKNDKI